MVRAEAGAAIVLLRGINVGGRNRLAMADLRSIAESCGFAEARTHLQSGNLVLPSVPPDTDVSTTLTAALRRHAGLDVPVIVRTAQQWAAIVSANPYPTEASDGTKVHVIVLSGPAADPVKDLDITPFAPDSCVVADTEVYLSLPDGLGRSKLAATLARTDNTNTGTTRNWNTVVALAELVAPGP